MAAPETVSAPAVVVANKGLLTFAIMLATIMQVLDTTIANVALPHMRSSLSASQDEINWVLTSYIVAAAIATPLTGWLADRLGRRVLILGAVAGFTISSGLCGLAQSLPEMVMFRVFQGICGAVMVPLAQSTLLDINPREKFGQAMAIFGAGIMVGPIIGPTLGGWLTETFNWRAVFLVNLPVGIAALTALALFMPKSKINLRRFDFFGFSMLAISIACMQLLLDRGQVVDWFDAVEIWIYLGVSISGLWVFIVHCLTAEDPFIDLAMFKDRNFATGLIFIFVVGITTFSGLALLPPLLQSLMGYPVIETGMVMAPRGVGTFVSMILVGRLMGKFDPRIMVIAGLVISAWSLYMMTGFNLEMDQTLIMTSGALQGLGLGMVFVPLSTLAFVTIKPQFRVDATSFFSLVRNVGSGVGISMVTAVLAQMLAVNHAELGERVDLSSPAMQQAIGAVGGNNSIMAMLDGLVQQQAAMIAYLDDFKLMMLVTLVSIPIVFFLKSGGKADKPDPTHAMAE
ncbi:DHA2 family efflux MFS transporter permease subunit [Devosia rhodophyticola]|uniref:DHA2 family efflux MFS transporter permease subunit n=1 Tax=Devosia rhodophyticola TaxID=3026423 RepID=A0ABY7YX22_9HYPH|nr:DHA2 family efflux MFS transporter permease subunit [Devosia rhodophyticola]WDR05928.1 DHA2 family efflux MFS transporter permease subunit [Devosia rhodophyticola]